MKQEGRIRLDMGRMDDEVWGEASDQKFFLETAAYLTLSSSTFVVVSFDVRYQKIGRSELTNVRNLFETRSFEFLANEYIRLLVLSEFYKPNNFVLSFVRKIGSRIFSLVLFFGI